MAFLHPRLQCWGPRQPCPQPLPRSRPALGGPEGPRLFSWRCQAEEGAQEVQAEAADVNSSQETISRLEELLGRPHTQEDGEAALPRLERVQQSALTPEQQAAALAEQVAAAEQEAAEDGSLPQRIGFIGAGEMGAALMGGFLKAGKTTPARLCASVRSEERRQAMLDLGLELVFADALLGGAQELAENADIIFLGVKPQYLDSILEQLKPHVAAHHLVISIAAGVRLASLEASLPEGTRVVRVMPNTPCLIGAAASAFAVGNNATPEDYETTLQLMSSVGLALPVEERMMDAVTGLSGSGPAYTFLVIEALADGAVGMGLPRDKALALAAQTVQGAARMVFPGGPDATLTHPALLRDRVTSPAGTTSAGLAELETSGVRGAFQRAVKAAAKRSEEMG